MFRLYIETDNEAFTDENELPNLIRHVAQSLVNGDVDGRVIDSNGNTVGSFDLTRKSGPDDTTWDTDEVGRWFDNDEWLYRESRLIVAGNTAGQGSLQLQELWSDANHNDRVDVRDVDWEYLHAELANEED